MVAHVVDVLVDFIGQDDDALVLGQNLCQTFQFRFAVNRTCRVAGRAEDEQARLGRDGCLKLCGRYLEILLNACFNEYGSAAGEFGHFGIAHPIGRGDNHLVAIVDEGHDSVAHALLCTVRYGDLGGGVVQSVLVLEFPYDGFAQGGIASHGRVARVVVVDGLDGGFLDVVGRVEVGLAHTEVDDVNALCLEFGTLLRHGQCGRWRKSVESVGEVHISWFDLVVGFEEAVVKGFPYLQRECTPARIGKKGVCVQRKRRLR